MSEIFNTNDEQDIFFEIGKVLTSSSDLYETLKEVLSIIMRRLPIMRGSINIYQEDTNNIVIDVSNGYSNEEISKGIYKPGEGIVGKVFETGKKVVISSLVDEPDFLNKTGARQYQDINSIAFICIPIKINELTVGVISADFDKKSELPLDECARLISMIAVLISHSVNTRREMLSRVDYLKEENRRLKVRLSINSGVDTIIGDSPVIRDLHESILMVADTDTTVLITGESGTGKELIANAIHYSGNRREGPYVKINIAAVPDSLIESELFGHERGAFTGAARQKKGKFELADGGTIFLDEIGDLSPQLQVHLLRVLQEKTCERLGGNEVIPLDIRVIAATNQNLEEKIRKNEFRQDLYYRLNVFPLHVPPLRKRKLDVVMLADYFLEKYSGKMNKGIKRISSDAIDLLSLYHWPGNVRELENCIERAVILCKEDVIRNYHLPPSLQVAEKNESPRTLEEMMDLFTKEVIIDHLKITKGNVSRAARMLGTTVRILNYRIKKLGIEFDKF